METRYKVFTQLILNISRYIQKIKNEEMSNFGLKGKQVQCLFSLYHVGGANLTELCEICSEDKGAMSRTIKELLEKKLVFVEEQNSQRYKNPIKLTQKGIDFAKIVDKKISCMLEEGGKGITEKERSVLYNSLTCISNNLKQICENYERKN